MIKGFTFDGVVLKERSGMIKGFTFDGVVL
jgi:hypothetical protein